VAAIGLETDLLISVINLPILFVHGLGFSASAGIFKLARNADRPAILSFTDVR
jgi:hypothetical protein